MGETGIGGPAFDAVGELIATEQLDVGVLRSARTNSMSASSPTRSALRRAATRSGRPSHRYAAAAYPTTPARSPVARGRPRRRRRRSTSACRCARPTRRAGRATGRRSTPNRATTSSYGRFSRTKSWTNTGNPPSIVMSRSSTRRAAGNRVVRPRIVAALDPCLLQHSGCDRLEQRPDRATCERRALGPWPRRPRREHDGCVRRMFLVAGLTAVTFAAAGVVSA